MYRIIPITLARVRAEKGLMTYLSGYGEKIWRPYLFWIIEGGQHRVLVDTAIHAHDYKAFQPAFEHLPIEHCQWFQEALEKAGMGADEVNLVIQTHLHFDHCYNSSLCKNAKVVVQEDELAFAKAPHPLFSAMYSSSLLKDLDFAPVRGAAEILPGIEVIPVPGHTPGCQAVAVMTEAGRAVISGFCSILENFFPPASSDRTASPVAAEGIIIPGIHFNAFQAYDSMVRIKSIADLILPVHEPSYMEVMGIP